jgi:methyl-accepting chemotaxis protein
MNVLLRNMAMKYKFLLLIAVMLAGVILVAVVSVTFLKESIIRERELKSRQLVEAASGVLTYYSDLAKSGKLPEDAARSAALKVVRRLRYDNSEYFWINDMQCRMLMHPTQPELEGKDLSDLKDPQGTRLIKEFTDVVKSKGAGFVYYLWPKPDSTVPVEKLSFVQGFAPWGWVIGTGIYIDDVNGVIWQKVVKLIPFVIIIMGVITLLSWLIARNITVPVKELSANAERITAGDLSVAVQHQARDEIGQLADSFRKMTANLHGLIGRISVSSEMVATAASQLSFVSTQVASGAIETATAVSETTATIEEVKQTAQAASVQAHNVSDATQNAVRVAQGGRKAVDETVSGMGRIQEQVTSIADSIVKLSEQGQAIGEIIATVNDLAEQSNLLAVNAAIEAAKAGEQGKGFAVVAQEVKSLAVQSKEATAQVRSILSDIQKATNAAVLATEQGSKAAETGVRLSQEAGDAIRQMEECIEESAQAVLHIAASSRQQLTGTDQVALAMENIKQASEQNVAGTRQVEETVQNLQELGQKLKGLVEQYKVQGQGQ